MQFVFRQPPKPRLRVLGDHSHYHSGCKAVMRTLLRLALKKGWQVVGEQEPFDALLVNGEGSMHDGSNQFHRKMEALRGAVDQRKPAYLVNSVWQDNPNDFDDVLQQLSGLFVREVLSQNQLLDRHGVTSTVFPDASYFDPIPRWVFPQRFHNRPVVSDFFAESKKVNGRRHMFKRFDDLFKDAECLPFIKWSWAKNVVSLRGAAYLITGRHHAVYAACVARIPFMASDGNTHKISGLVKSSGANIRVASRPQEIAGMIDENLQSLDQYDQLFRWLDSHDIDLLIPSPETALGHLKSVA